MNNGVTITAPVSTTDVGQVIGLSTHNVGRLIASAKSGGLDYTAPSGETIKSAFYLKGMGAGSFIEGELIDGAQPFWNIWSKHSPGFLDQIATLTTKVSTLVCRLDNKIDGHVVTDLGYVFRLGGWKDYNHAAKAPVVTTRVVPAEFASKTVVEVSITYNDFDWASVFNTDAGNMGMFVIITNAITGALIKNLFITPKDLQYTSTPSLGISGSAIAELPYYGLNVNIEVGSASYTMIAGQEVTYDMNKAVMFGRLLGRTRVNNTEEMPISATFQWQSSPYLKDNNITVTKQTATDPNSGGIKVSGGYIYPAKQEDGTPNIGFMLGATLRYKVIDLATNKTVHTGNDTGVVAPTNTSDFAVRFSTNINYPYSAYNLKVELWFA